MSFSMDWSHDFCLACDRQTDGNVYCSESCRLAEYEQSNAGSTASSPTSPIGPASSWSPSRPTNGFYMEPAYNFTKAQPYTSNTSPRTSTFYQPSRPQSSPASYRPALTPSSSQSSLFSMQSSSLSAAASSPQISEESRRALKAYASSFDQSRYSRRQSNH